MKLIVIVPRSSAEVISAVRSVTGASIAELGGRIRPRQPAAEFSLFFNDHDEVAAKVRLLLRRLQEVGVVPEMFLIESDEEYDQVADLGACAMLPQAVENVLQEHEREIARQRALYSKGTVED